MTRQQVERPRLMTQEPHRLDDRCDRRIHFRQPGLDP